MDEYEWDGPTEAEIEARMEAARAWDEASCAEHYWVAQFWFYENFVGPGVDIPF